MFRHRKSAVTFLLALAAVLLLGFLAGGQPTSAAGITVNTTADELNADGDCSLREAIEAANTDVAVDACTAGSGADTITVPAGTYALTDGELSIGTDMTISGAGAASTIVDGGDNGRVFFITDPTATVVINDLTVQNGTSGDGGGILVNGDLTIDNVVVQDSFADGDGGGIFVETDGTLTATNCEVSGNEAADDGGGIANEGPDTLNLSGCTVSGNHASNNGGGIANNFEATGVIDSSTISGNTADGDGGGVSNDQCCDAAPLVITNSTISGNTTGDDGGGMEIEDGAATFTNVTFSGNTAPDSGGGLIVDLDSSAALTNVTISNNTANSDSGGGLNVDGTATLLNTIVAANPDGDDCLVEGTLTSNGHNLDSDATCGFAGTGDQSGVDPLLAALALNAPGSTETHALTADSPAVDTADDDGCPAGDQRGVDRPQDGNQDGTAVCDIGAYELEAPAPEPTPSPTEAAPAALPPTGGQPSGGDGWTLALAVGAVALLGAGGALVAVRRRR